MDDRGYAASHQMVTGMYWPFVPSFIVVGLGVVALSWRAGVGPSSRVRSTFVLPAGDRSGEAPCGVCGAPLVVPPVAWLIVTCLYCGADHLHGARAARRRAQLEARAERAAGSLLDATEALHRSLARTARAVWLASWLVVGQAIVFAAVFT